MTETAATLLDKLGRPHVAQGWLAAIEYPDGMRYYHDGWGPFTAMGHIWNGVNDPAGSAVVSIGAVRMPRFGQAPYVDIVIAAATPGFARSFWISRADFEGAECNLYYRTVDQEDGTEIIAPRLMFPGKLTAGKISRMGPHHMALAFRVVSVGEGLNFPAINGDWSPAGQRARYAGDAGLDLMTTDIIATWRP